VTATWNGSSPPHKRATSDWINSDRARTTINALYIVLDGLLSVYTVRPDCEIEIARLGAGEMVGEMSFIDARPPSATVKAIKESLVLAIPRSQLVSKLAQDSDFASRFYRALAIFLSDRLRGMVGQHGYGKDQPAAEATDELDESVLDNLHLAGSRFDRILKRLVTK